MAVFSERDKGSIINFDSSKSMIGKADEKPTDCKKMLEQLMSKENQSTLVTLSVISNRSDSNQSDASLSDEYIPLTTLVKKN